MLTSLSCQKWIQSSTSDLLRHKQAERDRLMRLIKHEQQILDDTVDNPLKVEQYTGWIAQHTIEFDEADAGVEAMERGVQNYIVGGACSRKNIEYITTFIYDISIQNGATEQSAKEAQLAMLHNLSITSETFPIGMKTDAETAIEELKSDILT